MCEQQRSKVNANVNCTVSRAQSRPGPGAAVRGAAMQVALAAQMQGEHTGWSREEDAHGASKGPEQPCDRWAALTTSDSE